MSLLGELRSREGALRAARAAFSLMEELYPICRSITGPGVRTTLDRIAALIPLERSEVPSGTRVYDWEVPLEWQVRDAYIATMDGRRLVDFRKHNLHLVSYSIPVRKVISRSELEVHLHSLPSQPDAIPYRTSYYQQNWGFCLAHRQREALGPGPFEVVVDTGLAAGHLSYAESRVPGSTHEEALIYTHTCHPSLANDNLSGIAVATVVADALHQAKPRRNWRFVFAPGTIGSLTWLSRNEATLGRLRAGLVIGLLGDPGKVVYKKSRNGETSIDRAMQLILTNRVADAQIVPFTPYGYDERQFCSPGFNLPVGRLTRSPEASYPEYHTSQDDLSFVRLDALADSITVLSEAIELMDGNRTPRNLHPKGEPRLGARGLYHSVGGSMPHANELAMLWVLNLGSGEYDLLDIALRSGLPFDAIAHATAALEAANLIESDCVPGAMESTS